MDSYISIVLLVMAVAMFVHGFWISGKTHRHGFGHRHGGSILSVDYYAYSSKLRHWNTSFKVIFSIVILLLCLICNNIYVSIAVILVMGYMVIVLGGLSFEEYVSMMLIPIVFLIFGSLAIAVGFARTPVGEYNINILGLFYIFFSKGSMFQAANLIFKALGAVSSMYMMTLTTPLNEIISVLRKIHLPKIMIELMNMIYRYIFIMLDTHNRMKLSAESRLGYCDFKTSCYSFGQIASNLFVVSLKRGSQYYNALEARCYDGDLRFLEEERPIKIGHLIGGIGVVIFLIGIELLTR